MSQQTIKIAKKVISTEINGLKTLLKKIDKNFVKSINLLKNNKGKIILTGVGKSGIIAKKSLHVKDNNLTGYCFTPQDGNALLSSVAASVNYFYEDSWIDKMSVFDKYIFKNI